MKACARRISALSPSRGACGGDQTDANRQFAEGAATGRRGACAGVERSDQLVDRVQPWLTQLARVAAADAADYSGLDTLSLMGAQLVRPWPESALPVLNIDALEPLL